MATAARSCRQLHTIRPSPLSLSLTTHTTPTTTQASTSTTHLRLRPASSKARRLARANLPPPPIQKQNIIHDPPTTAPPPRVLPPPPPKQWRPYTPHKPHTPTTKPPRLTPHEKNLQEHFRMLEAEARENGTWKGVIHEITGLPIPPVLQFPERYVPYSKRNPKERPKPGVQKLDERGEALKVNPYAHILDSSLRQSHPHQSRLPSFLLLSFSLLKNPLAHPSKREKETYFLPTNILPSAASRSLSGQKSYVENSHVTIFNLKRKNTWRRLIPEDRTSPSSSKGGASPGNKEIHWRDDMSEYILSSLRKRVAWEAEKMHKVLPRASVYPVDTRGRLLNHSDNSLLFSGKERDYNSPLRKGKPVVSCILKWLPDPDDPEGKKKVVTDPARRTPHDPSEWLPVGKGKLHKLPSQETVPVHDVNLLMGRVEGERLKETLGLDKKVTMAAIVRHHQTYKTQMWLMKLRYYFK